VALIYDVARSRTAIPLVQELKPGAINAITVADNRRPGGVRYSILHGLTRRHGRVMKMLIIVARDSMLSDLEGFLHSTGTTAYTIFNNVMGKGVTGRVYGTFLHPDINVVIVTILPPDQAERAINGLKTLHARRMEASRNEPIPLKVFSLSLLCDENV
jgi:hypothetical protein